MAVVPFPTQLLPLQHQDLRDMAVLRVFIVAMLLAGCVWAADTTPASVDKADKVSHAPATTTPSTGGELSMIPQNLMQVLTHGGAVAVGLVVLAALAAFTMPLFGIKYCQVLGTCNDNYAYSNSVYQNDPSLYGPYPQSAYPSSNTYQKRSVDYLGPVVHMLKTAYDKYGQSTLAAINRKTS